MNSLGRRQFGRLRSTRLPPLAEVARTASTPLAVRLRRRKQFGPVKEGTSDATPDGLTPSEQARFTRFQAQGIIGENVEPAQWINGVNARRSRIRGFQLNQKTGNVEVLGRRVYLPNIVLKIVRNHTEPGQPYNPYEATFRIPKSVTKTDLRSLLQAVYGVDVTYIRTDNYISPWYRTTQGYERRSYKTYKRAVVGLVDPFYYPHRLEDMTPEKRKEREEWIEKHFAIQYTHRLQKEELLRRTRGDGKASYKFKAPYATKRSHILRIVNERRDAREKMVGEYVNEIRALRKAKEPIEYKKIKDTVDLRLGISVKKPKGKGKDGTTPPPEPKAPTTEIAQV